MTIPANQNQILASLSEAELSRLQPELVPVSLLLGDVIYDTGAKLQYAYFPSTAIISLKYATESGSSLEIAGVGLEGIVGFALYMGSETTTSSAVVQTAGLAYRLPRVALKREFDLAGNLQKCLLRYTHELMMQIGQTAVCNRHHSIDQQLCRWLLNTLDRLSSQELIMTQELISNMLGVRREAITEAAGRLQEAGFISYRRGHISVIDRKGLESRTCECYGALKKTVRRQAPDGSYLH